MIEIDGSQGEGGGQIIRSSLALAMLTGEPVAIDNIRARRKNPGLQRQHLTAVLAAARISGAGMVGASLHSSRLQFAPGPIRGGHYEFDVGSAGSTSLVLQTILMPLLFANSPSRISLIGGTHNTFAPPFDFLAESYLPQLARMGLHAEAKLVQRGFYPVGGGQMEVAIEPAGELSDYSLLNRGELVQRQAVAIVSRLPNHIAERELAIVAKELGLRREETHIEVDHTSPGPGNVVLVKLAFEHITEVVAGFGKRGVRAEDVAKSVAEEAKTYLDSGVPVGQHLADQLILPLAILAARGQTSSFRTVSLTDHSRTHPEIVQRFLDVGIQIREEADKSVVVELNPHSPSSSRRSAAL